METQTAVQVRGRAVATDRAGAGHFGLPPLVTAIGMFALVSTAAFSSPRADAVAPDAQQLLTEYKCYICHADHRAKAGPAYDDVASQFRAKRNAVSVIATEIRRGVRRGGPWHMPPHPEVSAAEARAMARYIMSLEPSRTPTAGR